MNTLRVIAGVLGLGLTERLVDILQPLAYLVVIVAACVGAWALVTMVRSDRVERDAAQRRADAEFAKARKVAR
jgi:NhaP-type Na+/H+ or K+/H+ antiporter